MKRAYAAVAGVVVLFLAVQLGALALVEPFRAAGYRAVEDPSDPTNSALYVLAILVATGVMLAAFRFGVEGLIRGLVVASSAGIAYYAFSVLFPVVPVAGVHGPAAAGALLLAGALLVHPEWYVIDAAGAVMGAGAAGLFGISFGLLPALALLVGLAVYDAISVYGTEHMLTLASGVLELKVPVVLVVPLTLSYSFLDADTPTPGAERADGETPGDAPADETAEGANAGGEGGGEGDGEGSEDTPGAVERDALFIGLGDAVIPTVLVASAAVFGAAPDLGVAGIALTLPALTALIGTLAGLLVLLWMVLRGRAHAGLPLLNGGAIAGYLLGAFAAGVPMVDAVGLGPYL